MEQVFFFYFASVIAAASVLVVAVRKPIYSALALLVMFFHVAGLYVTLHAEFLAAVQIIVYAGAILVLYLFVVMLLNLRQDDRYHRQWPMAAAVGVTLAIEAVILTVMKGWTALSWQPVQRRLSGESVIPGRSVTCSIPPICFPSRWRP